MRFIWMGAEAPNDVDLLYGAGVRDMGLSLSSFKRRVRVPQTNLERFDDTRLYLYDTEAWNTELDTEGLTELAAQYEKFLHQWYGSFTAFMEFDSPALGREWITERRDVFYDEDRFSDRFWVSWHPSYGLDHLKYLGESYTDVVVPVHALDAQTVNIIGVLKREYQTSFHCMGFSVDQSIRYELFDTVFMSTWNSALRHQDIYVPTNGNWIRRVPKDEQAAALKKHTKFIEDMGCDVQMLVDGNNSERELYTVRLFRWLEGHSAIVDLLSDSKANDRTQRSSGGLALVSDSGSQDAVQTVIPMGTNALSHSGGLPISDNGTLPNVSLEAQTAFTTDNEGRMTIAEIPVVRRSMEPVRSCDNCSLSSQCPAFTPAAKCKFSIPVQIRTREQMAAVTEAILEMQAARVMFAQFAEETSGYHDPTVGKEMDRFAKLATTFSKLGESKETLKVEATRTTQGGVLSSIFGAKAAKQEPDQ